jgi:ribosomal protein L11 methyltransferase
MKWHEIVVTTSFEASDALSEMLNSIGAGGVSIIDPNDILLEIQKPNSLDYADETFLEGLGEDVVIKAYFNQTYNLQELLQMIREKIVFTSQFLDVGKGSVEFASVDDEDWSTSWKKYYKPFHITDQVVIKPTWESYDKKDGEIVVELDPGMAFGTGTHETTKMCAEFLNDLLKPEMDVMDIGCGSGILAIIAALLGAKSGIAVDVDEVAIKVAIDNAKLNGVDHLLNIKKAEIDSIQGKKADCIVANIIANVILSIRQEVSLRLKEDGIFITSGIIKDRKAEVIFEYETHGFTMVAEKEIGEWVAIVFKCQGSL